MFLFSSVYFDCLFVDKCTILNQKFIMKTLKCHTEVNSLLDSKVLDWKPI